MFLKMWRLIGLPVFLGLFFLSAYLYYYLGGWKSVHVTVGPQPPTFLLYQEHRGPYYQINSTITAVENWAKENSLPCPQTFGRYLDDPHSTTEDRLKSQGGCVLEKPIQVKDGSHLLRPTLPQGWVQESLPQLCAIQAEFSGSPAIGPWKVYPHLQKEAQRLASSTLFPVTEIYTLLPDQKINTKYLLMVDQKHCP